ncbi:hypothetical protein C7271_08800 [filamentous cyanobacterium CCP5]|nr:hypothetical protein C7271_08800 [filamentous cyanobacterium CCP5]
MADIFISYSRRDKEFVRVLVDALEASKYDTWIDWQSIPESADWWREIEDGIEACHTFIFVITNEAVTSDYCQKEVAYAAAQGKRLIPVVRRKDFDAEALHPKLRQHHWLLFREEDDFEEARQKLVAAINLDLEHTKAHTRWQQRANDWQQSDRDRALLLRGSDLEKASQWLLDAAGKEPGPTALQGEYIDASRKAATNRQRTLVGVGALLLAAMAGLTGFSFLQYRSAQGALADSQAAQEREAEQRQLAEERAEQARLAQEQAEAAQAAEAEQRQQAQDALERAEAGETEAQKQAEIAQRQTRVAQQQRQRAEQQTVVAQQQTRRAEKQTLLAQQQTQIAEQEKAGSERKSANSATLAQSLIAKSLFDSNLQIEGLLKSMETAQSMQAQGKLIDGDKRMQTAAVLQEAVYSIREKNRLEGHSGRVLSVAFAPDGNTIASASDDGSVKLWDRSGRELQTLEGHSGRVRSVAFALDGNTIASTSSDGSVKLWDRGGRELQTLEGHSGIVWSVAFAPVRGASPGGNGNIIASASSDGSVKLWDRGGRELQTLEGHSGKVWSVAFAPDGNTIASASSDGSVKLWDRSGRELQTLEGHSDWVRSVAFAPDGNTIASASSDGSVKLWDRSGRELQTLKGHSGRVRSVAFSPDGNTIASVSDDGTVKLWNRSGRELQTLEGHSGSVWSVAFAPDGNTIASASDDRAVKLWNFNLDDLIVKGCDWLSDYMANPATPPEEKAICAGVSSSQPLISTVPERVNWVSNLRSFWSGLFTDS